MSRHAFTGALVAACSLLALAACSDEPAVEAPPPDAQVEKQPEPAAPEEPAVETAKEGFDKLRDAANQMLEDAKPAIDQARDAAGKLGAAVDEIVRKAQDDFQRATEELDKRLDSLQSERPVETGDPAAKLPPADKLRADARAAARASRSGIGPDYVGVWTASAADCAKVDQEPLEVFAVITPTTIRRYESVCNMPETQLTDGSAEIAAECVGEGEVETRTLRFAMSSPDRLTISGPEGAGVDLVQCNLAE